MDAKYILGIPEIDAQHEEISGYVDALRVAITDKDQRPLLHQAFKRLHQTLASHFEFEESLMSMVHYDDLPKHKKTRRSILKLFDDYFDNTPVPGDIEYFGNFVTGRVLGHIMEHDLTMIESVRRHMGER